MPFPLLSKIIILKNASGGQKYRPLGVHNFERSKARDANIGFGWERFVFPAIDFVYKYIKCNGGVDVGHITGARPTTEIYLVK
jgi:hypothetical protein